MAERVDLDALQQAAWAVIAELRELQERYGKDDEVWCGARKDQAGTAYCVEMAGHGEYGIGHMWHTAARPFPRLAPQLDPPATHQPGGD
jgi:hypothetical protein